VVLLAAAPQLAKAAPIESIPARDTLVSAAEPTFAPTATVTFNAASLQVNTRPAIPFTPFPMVDPMTMVDPKTHQRLTPKPLAPDATLTLPNGKVVSAQLYYSQLNNLEQWLSQHGYSLHDTPNNSQIELAKVPVDEASLAQQVRAGSQPTSLPRRLEVAGLAARAVEAQAPLRLDADAAAAAGVHTTLTAAQIADLNKQVAAAGIQGATVDGLTVSPAALAAIARLPYPIIFPSPPACVPVSGSRSWAWNVGGGDFNAYLNGSLSLTGEACKPPNMNNFSQNASSFDVKAAGTAGGHVFGAGGDLLRITGDLKGAESSNTITATFDVWLAGSTVYSLNKTSPTWSESNNFSKSIDFSASTTIFVGPIPLDLKIGARGSAGLQYSMNVDPISVSISGGPTVNADVYAQAGVDVVVASAGVQANLTLVNWAMNFHADAGVGWLFGFYVYDDVYADSKLNLLSGNVGLYASVSYPCWNWPPWCTSNYTDNLFSWSGLNFDSVLFNDHTLTPLNW